MDAEGLVVPSLLAHPLISAFTYETPIYPRQNRIFLAL